MSGWLFLTFGLAFVGLGYVFGGWRDTLWILAITGVMGVLALMSQALRSGGGPSKLVRLMLLALICLAFLAFFIHCPPLISVCRR